jgi:hypothetical protein
LRISIGAESEERIDQALQLIYDHLNGDPIDSILTHQELARLKMPAFFNRQADVVPEVDLVEQ